MALERKDKLGPGTVESLQWIAKEGWVLLELQVRSLYSTVAYGKGEDENKKRPESKGAKKKRAHP